MRFERQLHALAVAGLVLAAVGTARAQDSTTGAVRGIVRDKTSGEPVIGATVVATGPALEGWQATLTDETGQYVIADLPPGTYRLLIYDFEAQFTRPNVLIETGRVARADIRIDPDSPADETIVIEGRTPLIGPLPTADDREDGRAPDLDPSRGNSDERQDALTRSGLRHLWRAAAFYWTALAATAAR